MIIECPKCHKALDIAADMEGEYVQCYSCKTAFVSTKWSGVILPDAALERYLAEHEYEKKSSMVERCFTDSVCKLACSRLGVTSARFPIEATTVFEEEETRQEDSQAEDPYEGVYVIARLEKQYEMPQPSVALQEFIETTIGYRVEMVHLNPCPNVYNDVHRNYIRYFVHFDSPCKRTIFPAREETAKAEQHRACKKGRLRIIEFECRRTEDLLLGNIIESAYVKDFRSFFSEVCRSCGVCQLVVSDNDQPFRVCYDESPENIRERPVGVTIRIHLDDKTTIVSDNLLAAISRRLGRKLRFLGRYMDNQYDYYVETPLPHIASPEVKSISAEKEIMVVSSTEEMIDAWLNCPTLSPLDSQRLRLLREIYVAAKGTARVFKVLDDIDAWARKHPNVTGM